MTPLSLLTLQGFQTLGELNKRTTHSPLEQYTEQNLSQCH